MTALDQYIRAVGVYLRGRHERRDVLAELRELLTAAIEEREAELGRPLTATEGEQILLAHGRPVDVAARYGGRSLGLAFGVEVISGETFPPTRRPRVGARHYDRRCSPRARQHGRHDAGRSTRALPADRVRSGHRGIHRDRSVLAQRWPGGPQTYILFPALHRRTIARGQSVSGLLVLGTVGVWWAALPSHPVLLFGHAVDRLQPGPGPQAFYWPILALLAASLVQRTATLLRPDWSGLQFFTRLLTNGLMLAMVYPLAHSGPFIIPTSPGSWNWQTGSTASSDRSCC